MKIKRAAIRDANYEKQRDQLIPIAEAYACQKTRNDDKRTADYGEKWTREFCDQMKELAIALGIAVNVELGS